MIKNKTILEHKIEERIYRFECDSSSPLGEVYDAINVFKANILQLIAEVEKKADEVSLEEKK